MSANSIRDELKDRIRHTLASHNNVELFEVDADLVATLADHAFDICGIAEELQDTPSLEALHAPWRAIPWGGQFEIRDGNHTIGFVGRQEEGAIPTARSRVYAKLICAVPLFLRLYSLLLDREDIADSELGDLLREVAMVATGQKKLHPGLLRDLGLKTEVEQLLKAEAASSSEAAIGR